MSNAKKFSRSSGENPEKGQRRRRRLTWVAVAVLVVEAAEGQEVESGGVHGRMEEGLLII
jgi:hypothetical protein